MAVWGSFYANLAFVQNNTIYYKESPNEQAIEIYKEKKTYVKVGVADWVYSGELNICSMLLIKNNVHFLFAEEIFFSRQAIWLSDFRIAFATFDESKVRQMVIGDDEKSKIYYPTTGTWIPKVELIYSTMIDFENLTFHQIPVPSKLQDEERILCSVQWLDESKLLINWANRIQNKTVIQTYENGESREVGSTMVR